MREAVKRAKDEIDAGRVSIKTVLLRWECDPFDSVRLTQPLTSPARVYIDS